MYIHTWSIIDFWQITNDVLYKARIIRPILLILNYNSQRSMIIAKRSYIILFSTHKVEVTHFAQLRREAIVRLSQIPYVKQHRMCINMGIIKKYSTSKATINVS